jgi:hypothetical protein
MLLETGQYDRAEPLLRSALAWAERQTPGTLVAVQTRSALGAALAGQKKYAEAEPLLRAAYEGVKKARWADGPWGTSVLTDTLDRLAHLETARGNPAEAARWRAERAKYPTVAPPPREKK